MPQERGAELCGGSLRLFVPVRIRSDLRSTWIDCRSNLGNPIRRESAKGSMFLDQLLVGCSIDAVDLVVCNETFDPLDLRSKFAKDAARGLRDRL